MDRNIFQTLETLAPTDEAEMSEEEEWVPEPETQEGSTSDSESDPESKCPVYTEFRTVSGPL